MNRSTQDKIIEIHKAIDQAAQADLRGSITVNYGGTNRIQTEYNFGLTEKEALDILNARIEQKKLRDKNGFRG